MDTKLKAQLYALLLVAFLLFGLAFITEGADCGGATTCACNDTVIDNYVMPTNLTCSTTTGLNLSPTVSGKILDCNGNTISLSPAWVQGDADRYGIYLRGDPGAQVSGWTVINCIVEDFGVGIRLREASNNLISTSTLNRNGDSTADTSYGMEATQNSVGNTWVDITITDSGDEGFHCSGCDGDTMTGLNITGSGREDLYFLNVSNAVVSDSILGGATTGSNSHYTKDAYHNTYIDTDFLFKTFRITGAFEQNLISGGTMAGLRIDHYEQIEGDQSSYRFSSNNGFTNVTFDTATTDCLRIDNVVNTTITGGSAVNCARLLVAGSVDSAGVFYKATDIHFISGINPYNGTVVIDGGVSISVAYTLNVTVNKAGPTPLEGARVRLYSPDGVIVVDKITDATGVITPTVITVREGSMPISLTKHRLVIKRSGYQTYSDNLDITADTSEIVELAAQ